ncbi:MAG: hypothetical protein ABMA64_37015 [Myxococcota bacterium]
MTLHRSLVTCEELLARHLDDAQAVYGAAVLGVVDLPPLSSAAMIPAQLQVAATLYWAWQAEEAGLLPFVEELARALATGRITLPVDARPLLRFWRAERHRLTAPERLAQYSRLFGGPGSPEPNTTFDARFRALVETLAALGRAPVTDGIGGLEARARALAADLGADLSRRSVGMAAFAARDVVAQIRRALALLRDRRVVGALGPGRPTELVARHAPLVLGRPVAPDRHVARAVAGLGVLRWVAAEAHRLEVGTAALGRRAPVIAAAEAWLAAGGGVVA